MQSAKDVNSIFTAHVFRAAPEIASRQAAEVSIDDFVRIIGTLTEAGKGRTAAKLRSYLRAAHSLAIRSRTDPSIPPSPRWPFSSVSFWAAGSSPRRATSFPESVREARSRGAGSLRRIAFLANGPRCLVGLI